MLLNYKCSSLSVQSHATNHKNQAKIHYANLYFIKLKNLQNFTKNKQGKKALTIIVGTS